MKKFLRLHMAPMSIALQVLAAVLQAFANPSFFRADCPMAGRRCAAMELTNLWDAAGTLLNRLGDDDSIDLAMQQSIMASLDGDCDSNDLWRAISARILILKNLRADLGRV